MIVLRYKDSDIKVMLVSNCGLVEILVLKFVIPEHARMVNRYVMKSEHDLFIDCHPLCGGRDHAMVNSYQPFP